MEPREILARLIEDIAKALCRNPEAVDVSWEEDQEGLFYLIKCDQADARFLIGRQGKTAEAMKHLARTISLRFGIPGAFIDFDIPDRQHHAST